MSEVARQSGTRRRPLLDLFPSAPGEAPPSPALAAGQGQPLRSVRPHPRPTILDALAPPIAETLACETFYGLDEKPFSLSSDPKFLYHSTTHDSVAQELLSAIRRRDALVVITGETGVGKTTLCQAVMDQLDHRTLTSFVVDPSVSIEQLLETILIDFGVIARADLASGRLARASRRGLSTALREFLKSLAPLQAFAVVFIDEAQALQIAALEEIRTLSEVGGEGENRLLQIVLVGQPNLLPLLRRPEARQFAQRAAVQCELEPLPADEIVGYVLHRLAVAGTNARIEFDAAAFERLDDFSGGVPRVINLLCDHALKLGHDASAHVIDARMIERAADDLDIDRAASRTSTLARVVMSIAALMVLMCVGAGAGAFVFHDRLAQMVSQWRAIPPPPPPPPPARRLHQPAPLLPWPAPPPGGWPDNVPAKPPI